MEGEVKASAHIWKSKPVLEAKASLSATRASPTVVIAFTATLFKHLCCVGPVPLIWRGERPDFYPGLFL